MATRKAPAKRAASKKADTATRAIGRPTKLKPEMIEQAQMLCQRGFTDQELADFFRVSARTIMRWKNESEAFCHALKAGKEPADDRVERSLYASAIGYEHDEVDIRVVDGRIVKTPVRKFYAPNVVACIYWLKNRRPEKWRDKEGGGGDLAELAAALRANVAQANAETPLPAPAAS
jgi:hypothetical protein